jgi:hypothetical protein
MAKKKTQAAATRKQRTQKPTDTPPTEGDDEPRLRQSAAPLCPYHGVRCESKRSEPYFTRYYCPEDGCSYSQKLPKPGMAERLQRDRDQEGHSAR